jgi:long-chain acyl-CoA synthetase
MLAEKCHDTIHNDNIILSVHQVWVYGSSFKSCIVAVVVPSPTGVKAWAASKGITGEIAEICANPKAKEAMVAELVATGKAEKLKV